MTTEATREEPQETVKIETDQKCFKISVTSHRWTTASAAADAWTTLRALKAEIEADGYVVAPLKQTKNE